jgi:hypothetical protein
MRMRSEGGDERIEDLPRNDVRIDDREIIRC